MLLQLAIEDTDDVINNFYANLKGEQERPLLDNMTMEEKKGFAKKEMELNGEPDNRHLNEVASAQQEAGISTEL